MRTAYVALGSSVGDRLAHLSAAFRKLASTKGVKINASSAAYESLAVVRGRVAGDAPRFVNAVVRVDTALSPHELLALCKRVEAEMGRDPRAPRDSPRPIDLDVLLVKPAVEGFVSSDELTLPHPRLHERDFVLRPLLDAVRWSPEPGQALSGVRRALGDRDPHALLDGAPLKTVTGTCSAFGRLTVTRPLPGPRPRPAALLSPSLDLAPAAPAPYDPAAAAAGTPPASASTPASGRTGAKGEADGGALAPTPRSRPLILGVVNATPDSFSDGGLDPVERARELMRRGADALDVGGESTRPGATPVSVEQELDRVVPVVRKIRALYPDVTISIDTTKAEVAVEALKAGADVINDVTAGNLDRRVLDAAALRGRGLVLMHSLGTPTTMDALTQPHRDPVELVMSGLAKSVHHALVAGVPRWEVTVDPGLGFAKTPEQNQRLLMSAHEIRHALGGGLAVLIGASRKRFLRSCCSPDVSDHDWAQGGARDVATSAATALAVAGGADLVRVHDAYSNLIAARVGWKCSTKRA